MANQILIQGAGQAVKRYGGTIAAKGLSAIATALAEGGTRVVKGVRKKGEAFDKIAENVLQAGMFQSPEEYSSLVDSLAEQRKKYIWGNKKDRALLMQDLDRKSIGLKEIQNLHGTIAETALLDQNEGGLNQDWVENTKRGQDIYKMLNKDLDMVWSDSTQGYGYYIDDSENIMSELNDLVLQRTKLGIDGDKGQFKTIDKQIVELRELLTNPDEKLRGKRWMSSKDVLELVDERSFDVDASDVISGIETEVINYSKNLKPGQNNKFDRSTALKNNYDKVVKIHNTRSLVYDDHGPGSLYNNLIQAIEKAEFVDANGNGTKDIDEQYVFETLGLSQAQIDEMLSDILPSDAETRSWLGDDGKSTLSQDEAKQLVDNMFNMDTSGNPGYGFNKKSPWLAGENGMINKFFVNHYENLHIEQEKFREEYGNPYLTEINAQEIHEEKMRQLRAGDGSIDWEDTEERYTNKQLGEMSTEAFGAVDDWQKWEYHKWYLSKPDSQVSESDKKRYMKIHELEKQGSGDEWFGNMGERWKWKGLDMENPHEKPDFTETE